MLIIKPFIFQQFPEIIFGFSTKVGLNKKAPYFFNLSYNVRDEKDGEVGKVGYEINFNRYFYEYQPPRDLEEIEAEIKTLEKEIMDMLKEVTE